MSLPLADARTVIPPTGPERSARSWPAEAPLRMLTNSLHPEAAGGPENLVVHGGVGRAAERPPATPESRGGSDAAGQLTPPV